MTMMREETKYFDEDGIEVSFLDRVIEALWLSAVGITLSVLVFFIGFEVSFGSFIMSALMITGYTVIGLIIYKILNPGLIRVKVFKPFKPK